MIIWLKILGWSFQGTNFHLFSVKPGSSQWPRRMSFLVSKQLEYIGWTGILLIYRVMMWHQIYARKLACPIFLCTRQPVKQFIPDGVAGSPRFSQSELLACKFEQYYDDKQGCDDLVTSCFHFPTGTHLHTLPVRHEITLHINLIEHEIYKLHKWMFTYTPAVVWLGVKS